MIKNTKLLEVITIVFFIYVIIVSFQNILLRPFASFLIIKDSYMEGDLIVVSTGSYDRFLFASNLLKKSQASNMLILGDKRLKTPVSGKSPLDIAKIESKLLGLPKDKLKFRHSTSTLVDARQTKKIMEDGIG